MGRAGRSDKKGCAVIQTYNPEHQTLKYAAEQDFIGFYNNEILLRRSYVFPPFCDILLITLTGTSESELLKACVFLNSLIKDEADKKIFDDLSITVFGPFEAQVYKVNEKFRMRMILKCRLNRRTRALLDQIMMDSYTVCAGRVAVSIDVNPSNL
jgi:primosomal protein N' (replication factor Y)